jgi:hypothetical protein
MQQLHGEPYAIKAVAFWAIEACYHTAWSSVLNNAASAELREYSHRCVSICSSLVGITSYN